MRRCLENIDKYYKSVKTRNRIHRGFNQAHDMGFIFHKGEKRIMVNSKITIRKTFDISKDSTNESKREILNEIFTQKEIETIWNGIRSYASYLDYEKKEYSESKKYKKLAWVFYP